MLLAASIAVGHRILQHGAFVQGYWFGALGSGKCADLKLLALVEGINLNLLGMITYKDRCDNGLSILEMSLPVMLPVVCAGPA